MLLFRKNYLWFVLYSFEIVYSLKVIMDRANLEEFNPKYVEWARVYVKRYGRKSLYYLNIEGVTIQTWTNNVTSLKVIMDRANVAEFNPKYVEWARVYVKRYGRKSPYYLHIEGLLNYTWTNNVTLDLIFFEYLHNEYRRTFVEMHFKFCDAVNSDPYVGKMLASAGVTCPLLAGEHAVGNMTIEAAEFPNVWPFRKAKVEANIRLTDSKEKIGVIAAYLTFMQKKRNR